MGGGWGGASGRAGGGCLCRLSSRRDLREVYYCFASMINLQETVGAAAEGAGAAAAAMVAAATEDSAGLEALAAWQAACGGWQQAQPPAPRSATTSTPQRPRAPEVERLEIYCDGAVGCRSVQPCCHDQHRSPPREGACAAAQRRRSPVACTFATPLVTATRLVLISPSKLGRRPVPPKSGGGRQRRILQSIHSGNASCLFKRSATESVGDGNVGCRPTKELRWSMQSTEPSYTDAQQPYREAALIEAEMTRENASELARGDWPV